MQKGWKREDTSREAPHAMTDVLLMRLNQHACTRVNHVPARRIGAFP